MDWSKVARTVKIICWVLGIIGIIGLIGLGISGAVVSENSIKEGLLIGAGSSCLLTVFSLLFWFVANEGDN